MHDSIGQLAFAIKDWLKARKVEIQEKIIKKIGTCIKIKRLTLLKKINKI